MRTPKGLLCMLVGALALTLLPALPSDLLDVAQADDCPPVPPINEPVVVLEDPPDTEPCTATPSGSIRTKRKCKLNRDANNKPLNCVCKWTNGVGDWCRPTTDGCIGSNKPTGCKSGWGGDVP